MKTRSDRAQIVKFTTFDLKISLRLRHNWKLHTILPKCGQIVH